MRGAGLLNIGNDVQMSTADGDAALGVGIRARPLRDYPDPAPQGSSAKRAPEHNLLPKYTNRSRMRLAADVSARPISAADVAQARLFDEILQGEIAELEEVAQSAEARWLRRRQRDIGDDRIPEALVRLRARIDEVHRLLNALRQRFPQT